jgi:hypothetical protein
MVSEALGRGLTYKPGSCGYRFTNYDRKGTILRLPDDRRLVRGHTYTILPNGRMVKVPAALKQKVSAPAEVHDQEEGAEIMDVLKALMEGRKLDPGNSGRTLQNFDRRPNFFTRQADLGGGDMAHF